MAEGSIQDIVVVGGGLIGSAIALRLAQAGMKVRVLDRASGPGAEASGAAAGMIAPQGEMTEPDDFFRLCQASHDLYPEFVAEVEELSGLSVNYRSEGTVVVALTPAQRDELEQAYKVQSRMGLKVERLSPAEALRRLGSLSPEIEFGVMVSEDHCVDNERLSAAVARAAERAGVAFQWNCLVRGFADRADHVEAVITESNTEFTAGTFILAAGSWSGALASSIGIDLPVVPCRGQMIEFETAVNMPYVVRCGHHYLVPRAGRRVLAGSTSEYAGFDKVVTAGGIQSITEGAMRIIPAAKDFRFRRAWAGLRPDTKDHLPILGYGPLDNLVFATGHFRNGVLLTPETARLIAGLVESGSGSSDLKPYSPARFMPVESTEFRAEKY